MAKIGDFGVSSVLKQTAALAKTMIGTPFYIAPEVFQESPYSFEADIWSLGIILYEMCCLEYPF
jgi:NIMA (never in mitosis gene a)-related kinase